MPRRLEIRLPPAAIDEFSELLQAGVRVRVREAGSVAAFLTGDLGLDRTFIEERIGTVILDGRPVDDIDGTVLGDGCVLSLSAAMPGLVGSSLRRCGLLGPLRSTITSGHRSEVRGASGIVITLKLFNLLTAALGPGVLERGIVLTGEEMLRFIRDGSHAFMESCSGIFLEGSAVGRKELPGAFETSGPEDRYLLVVGFTGNKQPMRD